MFCIRSSHYTVEHNLNQNITTAIFEFAESRSSSVICLPFYCTDLKTVDYAKIGFNYYNLLLPINNIWLRTNEQISKAIKSFCLSQDRAFKQFIIPLPMTAH